MNYLGIVRHIYFLFRSPTEKRPQNGWFGCDTWGGCDDIAAVALGFASISLSLHPTPSACDAENNGNLIIQNEVANLLLMSVTADTLCCHTFIALMRVVLNLLQITLERDEGSLRAWKCKHKAAMSMKEGLWGGFSIFTQGRLSHSRAAGSALLFYEASSRLPFRQCQVSGDDRKGCRCSSLRGPLGLIPTRLRRRKHFFH